MTFTDLAIRLGLFLVFAAITFISIAWTHASNRIIRALIARRRRKKKDVMNDGR